MRYWQRAEVEGQVVVKGWQRYCSRSMGVERGMGGLGGRLRGEQIGLSTAGEQFLFKILGGGCELAICECSREHTWRLFAAVWLWVGTSCAQTAFQTTLKRSLLRSKLGGGRRTGANLAWQNLATPRLASMTRRTSSPHRRTLCTRGKIR